MHPDITDALMDLYRAAKIMRDTGRFPQGTKGEDWVKKIFLTERAVDEVERIMTRESFDG